MAHVAACLEHGAAQVFECEEGRGKAEYEEINRCVVPYPGLAVQPYGQVGRYAYGSRHEHEREQEAENIAVAHHPSCVLKVVCPDEMGRLHGETHCCG